MNSKGNMFLKVTLKGNKKVTEDIDVIQESSKTFRCGPRNPSSVKDGCHLQNIGLPFLKMKILKGHCQIISKAKTLQKWYSFLLHCISFFKKDSKAV